MIARADIQTDGSKKLFKVMKFGNERFVGREFDENSAQFSYAWKRQISYSPTFIYGTSEDMSVKFGSVSVLEFNSKDGLRLADKDSTLGKQVRIGPTSKLFVISGNQYEDVKFQLAEVDQDKSENRVRTLVGRFDRRTRKFMFVRKQETKEKNDIFQVGPGESLVFIESHKDKLFKLRTSF